MVACLTLVEPVMTARTLLSIENTTIVDYLSIVAMYFIIDLD
jgi:hypothetical protein